MELASRIFRLGLFPAIALGVIFGFAFPQEVSRAASLAPTSLPAAAIFVVEDSSPAQGVSLTWPPFASSTATTVNGGGLDGAASADDGGSGNSTAGNDARSTCDRLRRQWERAEIEAQEPNATEREIAKADELYWRWVEC